MESEIPASAFHETSRWGRGRSAFVGGWRVTGPGNTPGGGDDGGPSDHTGGEPSDRTGGDQSADSEPPDRWADAAAEEGPTRVLHVDDDGTVRERVASLVAAEYDVVTVTGTAEECDAVARLEAGEPDVLLFEPDTAAVDAGRLLAAAAVPVVFYTRLDPGELSESVFAAADTFVEKWTAEAGLRFVVEKVLWTVRESERESRLARALDPVAAGESQSCQFLLYEDGTPVWESESLADFLAGRGVTVTVPETTDFYRTLGAVVSHDPDSVRAVRTAGTPAEPTEFTLPTERGRARFRYTEDALSDLPGPVRLAVVEDVTRRGRSDARLELLTLLDEHVQDGISVVDADGRIEYHNDSFGSLLGYDDMVGEHSASYMAPGELERGQRAVQRLLASDRDSEVLDMEFVTADGDRRTLAVHFTAREDDGEYEGLVNVARDISDRRERERQLERYRTLVEHAGDPMFVVDADCRLVRSNEAMSRLFYAADSSLAGTELADLFPEGGVETLRPTMERARETGESATCELRLPDVTDDERRFEVTVAPLPGEGGDAVGILHEVTERQRRESELDLLKQVLARVLRHDVRTGLTVVRGQAEVLAERTDGEEREMAETIVRHSEELVETAEKARAIEQVIDSDDGQVTMDLRTVVNRAVANVAAAYPDAEYDATVTRQVPVSVHEAFPYAVENLVENAVEHGSTNPRSQAREDAADHDSPVDEMDHAAKTADPTAGTGRRNRHDPTVTVSATVEADTVALHVADDGPGISEQELEVISEREETPLKHGTGIGLWLVDWVVEHSGGDLTFDTGDEGTTVTVRVARGDPDELGRRPE